MSKQDIYTTITNRIIELMEGGLTQWRKTWTAQAAKGLPYNASTGVAYSGVNTILLWSEQQERGYTIPRWLTYVQAKKLGGQVRKGEKGTAGLFFSVVTTKESKGSEEEKTYPMAKQFTVFNVAQIDGLPEHLYQDDTAENQPKSNFNECEKAERFLKKTQANIIHCPSSKAFYRQDTDAIHLPFKEDFLSEENYYATAFHELVHWTSASTRCDRELGKRFGDDAYAMEELVAELGSAFLCTHFSFIDSTIENHASYLDSWLTVLKKDSKAFVHAASQAQKAFKYLDENFQVECLGTEEQSEMIRELAEVA